MRLDHEKLQVYQRALSFNAKVCQWVSCWDKRHAICDQMDRAAGSILENIAMSSASRSRGKIRCIGYAVGSTLECAACLDLSRVKGLLSPEVVRVEKHEVLQIVRMLIGLRKAWSAKSVCMEDRPWFAGDDDTMFHHERLDVYRHALGVVKLLAESKSIHHLTDGGFRRLDELSTSMVLNIAEGNGRYSDAEQYRFAKVSHESAVKLAARLDLLMIRGLIPLHEVEVIKACLVRVSAMLIAMSPEDQYVESPAKLTTKLATKGPVSRAYS
mgnify:CR=1 FL=1